jgi:hypothetical protein
MTDKQAIISALAAWIKQRPGLEYGNYGDPVSYRAELRSIGKDLTHARALLNYVESCEGITGETLAYAFSAFSGRLSWDGAKLNYCVGQYWPTEYRRAACGVLASAIFLYWRDDFQGDGFTIRANGKSYSAFKTREDAKAYLETKREILPFGFVTETMGGNTFRQWIQGRASRYFGVSISRRWFD